MKKDRRPRIFIGSSSQSIEIASAIQSNLCENNDVEIWDDSSLSLSESILDNLLNQLVEFDFAILVLTPDDSLKSNGKTSPAPRDNVIFELSLCMGILGKRRTFFLCENGVKLKLPTDLDGIIHGSFYMYNSKNLKASLRPLCSKLQDSINKISVRKRALISPFANSEVDIYYNAKGISSSEANKMVSELRKEDIRAYARKHDIDGKPDSIFIGCLVTAELFRIVYNLLPKSLKIKFIFRLDYPDSEGGDQNGYKIGIGYQSGYNEGKRSKNAEPVKVSSYQLKTLSNPELTNTDFQLMLSKITNSFKG